MQHDFNQKYMILINILWIKLNDNNTFSLGYVRDTFPVMEQPTEGVNDVINKAQTDALFLIGMDTSIEYMHILQITGTT